MIGSKQFSSIISALSVLPPTEKPFSIMSLPDPKVSWFYLYCNSLLLPLNLLPTFAYSRARTTVLYYRILWILLCNDNLFVLVETVTVVPAMSCMPQLSMSAEHKSGETASYSKRKELQTYCSELSSTMN